MNDSIISSSNQAYNAENCIFVFADKEIYFKLLAEGIAKEDISLDGTDAFYVRIEHFPLVEKICLPYDIHPQIMNINFDKMRREDLMSHLLTKRDALMKNYGDHISECKHLDIVLASLEEEKLTELQYEPLDDIVNRVSDRIQRTRLQDIIGLRIDSKFIRHVNTHMFGLRGIIGLTAAPGCGKSILAAQMIIDALKHNKNCCAIFVSLEMSKEDIVERMIRYLAKLTFQQMNLKTENDFTAQTLSAIVEFKEYSERLIVLGDKECRNITSTNITNLVNKLKNRSGCTRSILVIDYLQVWPIDSSELKSKSDIDIDKWLMSQMLKLQELYTEDPAIIICESRKPSTQSGKSWGSELADISGSSRFSYAFQAFMTLQPLNDIELLKLGERLGYSFTGGKKDDDGNLFLEVFKFILKQNEICLTNLHLIKARNMITFTELLALDHLRNKFSSARQENMGDIMIQVKTSFEARKKSN